MFNPSVPLRPLLAVSMTFMICGAAAARDSRNGTGSAILPVFSVQHEVMHPGEMTEVQACVVNGNMHASRDVAPGDAFTFTFTGGSLGACVGMDVHSPSGALAPGDFQCSLDGDRLTITYVGSHPVAWAGGDMACMTMSFAAPDAPATVLASYDVSNEGAYAPPEPRALVLSVGARLGTAGPAGETGPAGPVGPEGPRGPSGAGNAVMAVSTGTLDARCDEAPALIPGLDARIDVRDGSRLAVTADLYHHEHCFRGESPWRFVTFDLEVDGTVLGSRDAGANVGDFVSNLTMVVLTDPLSAGEHQVRALVRCRDGHLNPDGRLPCVGSAANDGDQARMILVELPRP